MRLLKQDAHVQDEYGEAEEAAAYRMRASPPRWARCRSYLPDDRSRSKLRQTPEVQGKGSKAESRVADKKKAGSGQEIGEGGRARLRLSLEIHSRANAQGRLMRMTLDTYYRDRPWTLDARPSTLDPAPQLARSLEPKPKAYHKSQRLTGAHGTISVPQ
jgi:hypothetical protein